MERDNTNEVYKECLRNHAASLGSYAIDGCGEFAALDLDHISFLCAACGCHRNFHRKITSNSEILELYNNSINIQVPESPESGIQMSNEKKKRCRTKFTEQQKEKMQDFAENLGWKLQRRNIEVERFCKGVGVSRKVFKVWMHNHKNSPSTTSTTSNGNVASSRAQEH